MGHVKRFLAICLFISCNVLVFAQQISVKSFKCLDADLTARLEPQKDFNNEPCALIKIVTSINDFVFEPDALGITERKNKTGEVWIYVPHGSKRLTIKHASLGVLRNYSYPLRIEKSTVYEMVLTTGSVQTIVQENVGGQYFILRISPADAEVYIDEQFESSPNGTVSKMLKYGEHTYRIQHPLYETTAGNFQMGNEKKTIEVQLKPAFGFLSIHSVPTGAAVSLNGRQVGKTPFKSDQLREGSYALSLEMPMYAGATKKVEVVRNLTQTETLTLSPEFGFLEIQSTPEQGAEVYINSQKMGVTPYKSQPMASGTYRVRSVLPMYQPQEQEVIVRNGETKQVKFDLAASFAQVTLKSDKDADLWVNEQKMGVGQYSGRLTAGLYVFKACKEGYRDSRQSVDLKAGETREILLPSPTPMLGSLNVTSNPIDALIRIDGKEYGTTPSIIPDLLIGQHQIELTKQGCAPTNQNFNIEEGKIATLDLKLSQGKEVTVSTTIPATLNIDGKEVGNAPYKGILSYGKHVIIAQNPEKEHVETIEINTNAETNSFIITNKKYTMEDIPMDLLPEKPSLIKRGSFTYNKAWSKPIMIGNYAYTMFAEQTEFTGRTGMTTKLITIMRFGFNDGKWAKVSYEEGIVDSEPRYDGSSFVEMACLGGRFLSIIRKDSHRYILTQSGKWKYVSSFGTCLYQQKLYYTTCKYFEDDKRSEINLFSFDLEKEEVMLVKNMETKDWKLHSAAGLDTKNDFIDCLFFAPLKKGKNLKGKKIEGRYMDCFPVYRYYPATGSMELLCEDGCWDREQQKIFDDFKTKYVAPNTPSDYYENLK